MGGPIYKKPTNAVITTKYFEFCTVDMALQFVILATLAAYASASGIAAPLAAPVAVAAEPYDPNPQYSYGYEVQDPYTGDSHGQVESRSGDVVDYSADPINGFNAVVSKAPVARVAAPAPILPAPVTRLAAPVSLAPSFVSAPASIAGIAAPAVSSIVSSPVLRAAPGFGAPLVSSPVIPSPALARIAAPWGVPALRAAPVW
ncbi:hypothetical protein NQ317_018168 [Molorchus minor]|uniref:Cuticle protein n=1 Tax=Molorchus minor TaxID=1323400 RepID=A0ABQ9JWP5_9CUCU|nr:hypothetical protein NQ317_018168 [Molorchus minor]